MSIAYQPPVTFNIKELVVGTGVRFVFYRKGELWYEVIRDVPSPDGLTRSVLMSFPVPISDTGDGTFLPEDKAITYMRWIRKQLEELKKETQ